MINKGMRKEIMVNIHVIEYFIFKEEENLDFSGKCMELEVVKLRGLR